MSRKKNLVLTILHGYTYPFIEPFIKSFIRAKVDAELVIFTSETISPSLRGILVKKGAVLIDFDSKRPLENVASHLKENLSVSISLNNYRFILFLEYLIKNKNLYETVILTDIRDVIFQNNPFKEFQKKAIYFFLEGEEGLPITFRTSKQNHIWSVEANGEEFTESILDKSVSCAGVTAGDIGEIINYLEYMRISLSGRDELKWGIDQGIHNGYIYLKGKSNIVLSGNESPIVCTLGVCEKFKLNDTIEFVTKTNKVYSVVHQYDRIRGLNAIIRKKYIGIRLIQIIKKFFYTTFH